ncbi:MAG: B12-binding domain-containing radical SAM protein [Planctomycetota bacterium]|jgi:radical SAM superfamily enzyme YgiQ (UPF0313 family)
MKLLLLSPSDIKKFSIGQPRYYSDNQAVFPPLSLLPLASYIKKNSSHIVKVIDMAILNLTLSDLHGVILSFKPNIIGITCMINNWYAIVQILRYIKSNFPHIKTVVGGYNTSEYPEETILQDCIDFMILGTGQEPLKKLLDYMEAGNKRFTEIKGLFLRDDQKRNYSEEKQRIDPDLFPFPDRTCVPYKKYRSAISQRFPSTVMISSDGCPFRCRFCNTSNMKNIIIRDPIKVVDEMEECVLIGIKEIMFQDELFTVKKDRVYKICQEIIDRKLDIVWNFKSRINLIEEDVLPYLKRAGCSNIHFGVENGNDEILEQMNKGITTDQVRKVFKLLQKYNIDGSASFMIAYPGETLEQIHNTIDFAIEINPSFVQFAITCDYPGTQIYLDNLRENKYNEDIWKKFVLNPTADFRPPYSSNLFNEKQLDDMLNYAYRKYYLRYSYIKKRLLSLRSTKQFTNQLKIAKDIILKR